MCGRRSVFQSSPNRGGVRDRIWRRGRIECHIFRRFSPLQIEEGSATAECLREEIESAPETFQSSPNRGGVRDVRVRFTDAQGREVSVLSKSRRGPRRIWRREREVNLGLVSVLSKSRRGPRRGAPPVRSGICRRERVSVLSKSRRGPRQLGFSEFATVDEFVSVLSKSRRGPRPLTSESQVSCGSATPVFITPPWGGYPPLPPSALRRGSKIMRSSRFHAGDPRFSFCRRWNAGLRGFAIGNAFAIV